MHHRWQMKRVEGPLKRLVDYMTTRRATRQRPQSVQRRTRKGYESARARLGVNCGGTCGGKWTIPSSAWNYALPPYVIIILYY
jgi:hypothetical protein